MGHNRRTTSGPTAALAAAIREAQGRASLSTAAFARASGVPYSTLWKIRKGEQAVDWEEIIKLARAQGVSASELARRAEEIEADES